LKLCALPGHLAYRRAGRRALPGARVGLLRELGKKSAYYHVITVVGSFFPRLFQVSFEFLDSLVEGSIVIETFRLEQIL
jgi:hypothetical protein